MVYIGAAFMFALLCFLLGMRSHSLVWPAAPRRGEQRTVEIPTKAVQLVDEADGSGEEDGQTDEKNERTKRCLQKAAQAEYSNPKSTRTKERVNKAAHKGSPSSKLVPTSPSEMLVAHKTQTKAALETNATQRSIHQTKGLEMNATQRTKHQTKALETNAEQHSLQKTKWVDRSLDLD